MFSDLKLAQQRPLVQHLELVGQWQSCLAKGLDGIPAHLFPLFSALGPRPSNNREVDLRIKVILDTKDNFLWDGGRMGGKDNIERRLWELFCGLHQRPS
jgi:hypothetical protein